MLLGIGLILLILWALGFVVFHVTGFLIHILLIVAVIAIIMRLLGGGRPA